MYGMIKYVKGYSKVKYNGGKYFIRNKQISNGLSISKNQYLDTLLNLKCLLPFGIFSLLHLYLSL